MKLKRNMGLIDRVLRVLLAFIAGAFYLTNTVTGGVAVVMLIVGAVFLLTGLTGFCPLYVPLKFDTLKK